jgi:Tfp pilus assembly protein PilN
VNAVNLLPTKHRPRTPTGGQQGSAYAVVGVLGIILVMVLAYVLTANGINSKKDAVTRATAETVQAEKRVKELSSYGNFSQVKEQRVSSVKQLAAGRVDWERLARGLAHVLPNDVWLLNAKAEASPASKGASSGASAPAPSTAPPAGGAAPQPAAQPGAKPELTLSGCAPDRHRVAVTLVRLRELSGTEDVQLNSFSRAQDAAAGAGASGTDCGAISKKAAFQWTATVVFKPNPGAAPSDGKVPARLGGGQ